MTNRTKHPGNGQKAARILVADDQPDVVEAIRLLVKAEGFQVETASSPSGVLAAIDSSEFDVALVDLNYTRDTTSGAEGMELLPQIRAADPTLSVVVMTAWGSIEGAVEAMRRGARDYIEKPWDNRRLVAILQSQVELAQALRASRRLADENRTLRGKGFPNFIANAQSMEPVLRMMERIGPSDANVLVTGEHGTGKDVVAQWLHASSERKNRPLITVNVGGLSQNVFESELFGHVKGAFTDARTDRIGRFELADGGTLFLDEIANIPIALQSTLLRVVQTGEFEPVGSSRTKRANVRIISATNADLSQTIEQGGFREDLLFRLNTVEIPLPPLRERRGDIPILAAHFLKQHADKYRRAELSLTATAINTLLSYAWPGNVRELDHVLERAVLMADSNEVDVFDLGLSHRGPKQETAVKLEDAERNVIQAALKRHNGNVKHAALELGISRSALYRRLQRSES